MNTSGTAYSKFEATKIQPWPNSSWAEMYRFEKDDLAAGYIYNPDGSNSKKWIDEIKTLTFAIGGL